MRRITADDDVTLAPIKVFFRDDVWFVDYGEGVQRTFASREEAVAVGRDAAAIEERELEVLG